MLSKYTLIARGQAEPGLWRLSQFQRMSKFNKSTRPLLTDSEDSDIPVLRQISGIVTASLRYRYNTRVFALRA
ncbi:hypothetical protein D9758_004370 [Tetrapyrgos nigripes]|uniref:Uncharacterized protein n=1 Tax=Tetrapyrgos nigripes TaxID=182062 RepID=A0A8H5GMU3_9AGAR|nr:hypothetical protein D9758_004370 [Tetrapyrgos nigripes]